MSASWRESAAGPCSGPSVGSGPRVARGRRSGLVVEEKAEVVRLQTVVAEAEDLPLSEEASVAQVQEGAEKAGKAAV